jgi:hypothetical protein
MILRTDDGFSLPKCLVRFKDQPATSDSCVESYDGKYYVVLRNFNGEVYRVLNNGALKGLRLYPKAFDE